MSYDTTKNKIRKAWEKSQNLDSKIVRENKQMTIWNKDFNSLESVQAINKKFKNYSSGWVQMNQEMVTVYYDLNGKPLGYNPTPGQIRRNEVIAKDLIRSLYYEWRIEIGTIRQDMLSGFKCEAIFKEIDNDKDILDLYNYDCMTGHFFEVKDLPNPKKLSKEPDKDYSFKYVTLVYGIVISNYELLPKQAQLIVNFIPPYTYI